MTSSDSKILEVFLNEDGDYEIIAKGEGVVVLTVKCGNATAACEVTVYADEDAYYENY